MACGRTLGSLNAFQRITTINNTVPLFFPTTDWMPCTGLEVRAWLNLLNEGGDEVDARPAIQYAEVITDQPAANGGRADWAGDGQTVDTEGMHAFGDITLATDKQWVRFGFEAQSGTGGGVGQADISVMYQIKPCGKVVGNYNVAGIEADATRDVPVSDWFVTVDTTNLRIGYALQAPSGFKIDWYIQTADDTNRPNDPTTLTQTQVAGSGSTAWSIDNTGDIDISAVTTPASATATPAYARIIARMSAASPESADQLIVNVQVS